MSDAIRAAGLGSAPIGATSRAMAGQGRLTNLQILRALAAGFVALLHASLQVETTRGDGRFVQIFNVQLGVLGVALFFAMSGFLMAQLVRAAEARTFLLHRVIRIYPIFLIVAALYSLSGPLLGLDVTRDWLALTLAPTGKRSYVLGIEWTLLYETTFYVALFLISALGLTGRLDAIAIGWIALIAGAAFAGHEAALGTHFPRLHYVLFSEVNLAFAGGLLVPPAIRRGWLPPRVCLLAGPAALVLVASDIPQVRWWLSLAAVLIVAGAVQVRQVSVAGVLGRWAVRFGDWSYALYLVHIPMIVAAFRLAPASMPTPALFAGAIGLSLAAAALFGSLDVALYRRLRRLSDRLAPRRAAIAAYGFALVYLAIAGGAAVQVERQEAAIGRVRAILQRLPAGSLANAERLAEGVLQAGLRASPDLVGRLDRVERLPTGQLLAVGWAADLARPGTEIFLALACGDRVVTIVRPQRFRPDIAAALRRDDLRGHRIGFTAGIDPGACPAGSTLLPVFVVTTGSLLPGPGLDISADGSR